jgi:hypothetical protein
LSSNKTPNLVTLHHQNRESDGSDGTMAKIKPSRNHLHSAVSVLIPLRLPPDFVIPADPDSEDGDRSQSQDASDKWSECFQALHQVPGLVYIKCGRLVEDPMMATFFMGS